MSPSLTPPSDWPTLSLLGPFAVGTLGALMVEALLDWFADVEEFGSGEDFSLKETGVLPLLAKVSDSIPLRFVDLFLAVLVGLVFDKVSGACQLTKYRNSRAPLATPSTESATEGIVEEPAEDCIKDLLACAKGVNVVEPELNNSKEHLAKTPCGENQGDFAKNSRASQGREQENNNQKSPLLLASGPWPSPLPRLHDNVGKSSDISPLLEELRNELDNVKNELIVEERTQAMQQRVKNLVKQDDMSWWPEADKEQPFKWLKKSRANLRSLKNRLNELNRKIEIIKYSS